jgi:hypothetical protein
VSRPFSHVDRIALTGSSSAGAVATIGLVEGFRIPLVEAARYGSPIALGDIRVFRQILHVGPQFFDSGLSCRDGFGSRKLLVRRSAGAGP